MNKKYLRGGATVAVALAAALAFSGPTNPPLTAQLFPARTSSDRSLGALNGSQLRPVAPAGQTARVGGANPLVSANSKLMAKKGPSLSSARHRAMSGSFMKNNGQWPSQVMFMASSHGLDYWVTKNGVVLDYNVLGRSKHGLVRKGDVVRMALAGAEAHGEILAKKQAIRTDFLLAHQKHPITTASYGEVTVKDLYPGVSMRSYFESDRPRYDVIVQPGANPALVRFDVSGAASVSVDPSGALKMKTSIGEVAERGLKAYTVLDGKKTPVQASFQILAKNEVGFQLGAYDHKQKLVIDPLIFGSYFGGNEVGENNGRDSIDAVVSEPDGDIYMTGWTEAVNFPVIAGAYQINLDNNSRDAFVTLFRGDAYSVLYNSYFGGSGSDEGHFIQINSLTNQLWIAGITTSTDLPTTPGGLQPSPSTSVATNGFLLNFSLDSNDLPIEGSAYVTYFGPDSGSVFTLAGFVIAPNGNLLLAGTTNGLVESAVSEDAAGLGGIDVWLAVLDPTGLTPLASRLFGGEWDDTISGLCTDSSGDFVISPLENGSGATSQNYDLSNDTSYFETGNVGWANAQLLRGADMYVAKISSDPTLDLATIWSGVVGGSDDDFAPEELIDNPGEYGIQNTLGDGSPAPVPCNVACDINDNVYIVGYSQSFDYPRQGAVIGQASRLGVVVTKIAADGSSFVYSTGLNTSWLTSGPGPGETLKDVVPVGIGVDGQGYATITGMVTQFAEFDYTTLPPPNPIPLTGLFASGTIQTTVSALKASFTNLGGVDLPTTDGWINVISPAADQLVYGSYIGGNGNDTIEPPYVDSVGDIWIFGWTDEYYGYEVPPWPPTSGTPPNPLEISEDTPLPSGFITDLAFKTQLDNFNPVPTYGLAGDVPGERDYWPGVPYPYSPQRVFYSERTDGYILRFRLFLPTVQTIVLTPNIIPGGTPDGNAADGGISTGIITLSSPAPSEGVQVTLTLDNTAAAFFNNSTSTTQQIITFPAGATTETFTVASYPVTSQQLVNISANFSGNVVSTPLTVIPWLSQFVVTPSVVSGGTNLSARVGLSAVAPRLGVTVPVAETLTLPDGTVLSTGSVNVIVPAGSASVTQTIPTAVTTVTEDLFLTASLLGVSLSTSGPVVLTPLNINVNQFVINATTLSPGATTTGTIVLSTPAPDAGVPVIVTSSRPNAVYFKDSSGNPSATGTVTIAPGGTQGTITFYGGTVPDTRVVSFTASIGGGVAIPGSNTLTVSRPGMTFTLSPSSVPGGGIATGTLNIVDANGNALVATPQLDNATNNAQDLLTITLTNNDTIGAIASMSSTSVSNGPVSVTTPPWTLPVTIDPGTSTNQFSVVSATVPALTVVTLTATFGTAGDPTTPQVINQGLTVRAVGVTRAYFNHKTVIAGRPVAFFVELDAPVPVGSGGLTVYISTPPDPSNPANSLYFAGPSSFTVTIPEGQTSTGTTNSSGVFVESPAHTFIARKFSRAINATVTAQTGPTTSGGTTTYASTSSASVQIVR